MLYSTGIHADGRRLVV
ncbi:hypothetical protein VOD00_01425 [Escherichia coli]|nr:hypothetical protein [Escherichia albertii]MEB3696706.1 hypothetical protein [Escherichia coli]